MDNAVVTGDWSDPCFVKAGEDFMELIDLEPFQEGFLAAKWDGAGSGAAPMATDNGAMQLMGQWLPGTVSANSETPDDPRVAGLVPVPVGRGRRRRRHRRTRWRQRLRGRPRRSARDDRLPAVPRQRGRRQSLGSAEHGHPADDGRHGGSVPIRSCRRPRRTCQAEFVQLYLDQATTPDLGAAINEAVATLYAGTGTPESVAEAITRSRPAIAQPPKLVNGPAEAGPFAYSVIQAPATERA